MRTPRSIDFSESLTNFRPKNGTAPRRDSQNRVIVPVYSSVFSEITDNVMCTNVMFDKFRKEIEASVSLYSAKEDILLTIYESSDTEDRDTLESVMVGFKKYIRLCKERAFSRLKKHFLTFLSFFVIGVLIEVLLDLVIPETIAVWAYKTLDAVANVFLWQFVTYLAFEFSKEKIVVARFDQMLRMEYVFRHWD